MIISIFFIVEDLFNILGDSWSSTSGKRRMLVNGMDILLVGVSFIYYFLPCTVEKWCKLIETIIILCKIVRSYKVVPIWSF